MFGCERLDLQHLASSIFTSEHLHISDLRILHGRIRVPSACLHISDPHISGFHILRLHIRRSSRLRSSYFLILSSHLRRICAPSHLRTSHLRSSYVISLHLHHICITSASHLRIFISQIFTSSLSSSDLHIWKPHLVFTSSDLHHVVTLSYLIIFKISLCYIYNILPLEVFTSSKRFIFKHHLLALRPSVV